MNFLAVKCPSCNGDVQIPYDKEFVNCSNCGIEIKLKDEIEEIKKYNQKNTSQIIIASMLIMALAGALFGNYALDNPEPILWGFIFGIAGIIAGAFLSKILVKPVNPELENK